MTRGEKWILASLCLVLISWVLEIFDKWPVLAAHLKPINWIMIALIHLAALLVLIGAYASTPKATSARRQVLLAAVVVVISWSMYISLIAKLVEH